jgi:anti-sigma factor RsiW
MAELHIDLVRFVDGELSDTEAGAFREHLKTCEGCAALLCEEIQLTARLSTLNSTVLPTSPQLLL